MLHFGKSNAKGEGGSIQLTAGPATAMIYSGSWGLSPKLLESGNIIK